MNFQVANLKHSERAAAVPMPKSVSMPVPLMDRMIAAPTAFTRDIQVSNDVTHGPSRLRRTWPIVAIGIGAIATLAWNGYLLWQVLRLSLGLFGFDI